MASGLVPTTSQMSAKRSLPPSSARAICLRYELSSTKIVGVGLQFQADRLGRHDMVIQPVLAAISDRGVFRRKAQAYLWPGVARPIPAGQRIGAQGFLPLELKQPAASIGLPGLGRLAVDLGYAGDSHRASRGKVKPSNQAAPV